MTKATLEMNEAQLATHNAKRVQKLKSDKAGKEDKYKADRKTRNERKHNLKVNDKKAYKKLLATKKRGRDLKKQ